MNFFIFFIFSLIIYFILTVGSGDILYWSKGEIILGIILSIITGLVLQKFLKLLEINPVRNSEDGEKRQKDNIFNGAKVSLKILNPLR